MFISITASSFVSILLGAVALGGLIVALLQGGTNLGN